MAASLERDIGRLEARVEALGQQIEATNATIKAQNETIKSQNLKIDSLILLLEQAKGGSKVILWLLPLGSGAAGALLMKLFPAIIK